MLSFSCAVLTFVLAQATVAFTGEDVFVVEVGNFMDTHPGHSRLFYISDFNGNYFYGSTDERSWDSGWMGLWTNRKRMCTSIAVVNATGDTLKPRDAECRVTPSSVRWTWDDSSYASLLFDDDDSTGKLFFLSSGDLTILPENVAARFTNFGLDTTLDHYWISYGKGDVWRAVEWSTWSLENLLADNDSLLYAGIPWFNEGWGRDTFISAGGLLAIGRTDVVRKLIIRFANWIERNPHSLNYGRIPNRVRPGEEIAYNTADGTLWWLKAIYDYGLYSGDYSLWSELLFEKRSNEKPWTGAARIALSGALANCDTLGFLKHGDQETWMDAVGTTGCVTPRGDRAVEIQALLYNALDCAVKMSFADSTKHDFSQDILMWKAGREKLERNFLSYYLNSSHDALWDHLNVDGGSDKLFRPNQLFAVTAPLTPLVPPDVRSGMLKQVMKHLVHPYGVLSLSPDAELFHPYHIDEHYPKDDAYHNGIVWIWLSGMVKDALRMEGRADLALELAEEEANLLLTRGMVGSLPELLDAMPRKGEKEPRISGCTSQAWSLAEFLRAFYQDILGIRPVLVPNRVEPFWLIDPRIPESWGKTHARINLEGTWVSLTMQNHGDSLSVTVKAETAPAKPLSIKLFDEQNGITGLLNTADEVHFVYDHKKGHALADGIPTAKVTLKGWPWDSGNKELAFSKPLKMRKWKALQPPPWEVLKAKDVLAKNENAKIIASQSDPVGDDKGDGDYTYPLDEHFEPGILDITNFEVREDKSRYYFTLKFANLVQPGWHPEYGFQLTYAAICLNSESGSRAEVGANCDNSTDGSLAAECIIFVGGGIRVEAETDHVLATYVPMTLTDAFGDTTTREINFALPKGLFPKLKSESEWLVYVGAQDDHGGAGMGEFRTVKQEAEQWAGGGKRSDTLSWNHYDWLRVRARSQ